MHARIMSIALALTSLGALVPVAQAAQFAVGQEPPTREPGTILRLDVASGPLAAPAEGTRLGFEHTVRVAGARWLWLDLAGTRLGPGSYLTLLAEEDGAYQVLDRHSLADWRGRSALFNGESVHVQLWVAAGDGGSTFALPELEAALVPPTGGKALLCAADDRLPSTDNRVGRVPGCTGWRVTNGAMLSAGHCGFVGGIMEFNVPASDPDGSTNVSAPEDQYPIDPDSFVEEFIGLGDDWKLYEVERNANTGLLPHEAYGLPFRVTQDTMLPGDTTRVTGFGVDVTPPGTTGAGNAQNRTNQTATGPFVSSTVVDADTAYVRYAVDITGGTSGGPVIMESSGVAIGINTNDGCNTLGDAQGCSFQAGDLAAALDDFRGTSAVHVDAGHPLAGIPDGTVFRPYATLAQGLGALPTNGVLSMVAGSYSVGAGLTLTTPMTLESPTGSAILD